MSVAQRKDNLQCLQFAYDNYYRYKCRCWGSDEELDENPADWSMDKVHEYLDAVNLVIYAVI